MRQDSDFDVAMMVEPDTALVGIAYRGDCSRAFNTLRPLLPKVWAMLERHGSRQLWRRLGVASSSRADDGVGSARRTTVGAGVSCEP